MRRLLELCPILSRIPDDTLLAPNPIVTAVPGAGSKRFVATRETDGRYAMIYVPTGRQFEVEMDRLSCERVAAWWYNPRNGQATAMGEFPARGRRAFLSPTPGEDLDWVLVLDDAAQQFGIPGQCEVRIPLGDAAPAASGLSGV